MRLTQRMAERKKKRRRFYKRIALAMIVVIGIFAGLWMAIQIGGWPLGQVVINGNYVMNNDEVLAVAGINNPINILSLRVDDINWRLSNNPRFEKVSVWREFPITIKIALQERRPIAYIATDYGFAMLDEQGMVLSVSKSLRNIHWPIITGTALNWQYIGDRTDSQYILNALTYCAQLSDNDLANIAEMHISADGQLMACTINSIFIRIGAAERLREKAEMTTIIMQELQKSGINPEYVDVQYATPVIKMPTGVVKKW